MSSSPSLEFDSEPNANSTFRPSVDIDLVAASPPKRAKSEVTVAHRTDSGVVEAKSGNGAKHEQGEEEESSSIDMSRFFVPLSKQAPSAMSRQMQEIAARPSVAPVPKADRAWKKKTSKKGGKKGAAKLRATKKGTTKRKVAVEEEKEEEEEDEVEVEEDNVVKKGVSRQPQSFFGLSGQTAKVPVEPARSARELYALLHQSDVIGSAEEKKETLGAMFESLHSEDRAPFVMMEEIDLRRFTAEKRMQ
jgi:hypothetical protein